MTLAPVPSSVPRESRPDAPQRRRDLPAVFAGALGLVWVLVHTGVGVLDPTNTGWLRLGDWGADFFGWEFFRTAPFGFPLGVNPAHPFPIGSSLAYSDSLPILGVLFRPLSPLLPHDFQYVGPWLALCFALQGFVGAKLVRLVAEEWPVRLMGGALFALAPPLLHRIVGPDTGHASLAAHWIILCFLWLALAPVSAEKVWRRLAIAAGLLLLSSGLHPYLTVTGLALAVALVVRLATREARLSWPHALAAAAGLTALSLGGLWAFGFMGGGESVRSTGFGHYSADGLTLVNPAGWSRWIPGIPVGAGQYEGFAYLGLGVLVLGASVAVLALVRRSPFRAVAWGGILPAAIAALLLAIFALSDIVTFGGVRVAQLELWSRLPLVTEAFRSSGRFVWPLHYLALLAAIAGAALALRSTPRVLATVLGAALLLQMIDVRPPVPMPDVPRDFARVRSDAWTLARGAYRHVAVYPPSVRANGDEYRAAPACGGRADDAGTVLLAADVADRIGATFNSGYLARVDAARAVSSCSAQLAAIASGSLDPETLYVVQPASRPAFRLAHAQCGVLDGLIACVKGGREDPFVRALALSRLE